MANNTDRPKDEPKRAAAAAGATRGGSSAVGEDDDVAFAVMAGIAVLAAVILLLTGVLNTSGSSTNSTNAGAGAVATVGVAAAVTIDATPDSITLSGTVPDEETAERIRAAAAASYTADQITDHLTIVPGAQPLQVTVTGEVASDTALGDMNHALDELGLGADLTNGLHAAAPAEAEPAKEEPVEEEIVEEEPVVEAAAATITAGDDQIVLDGTVPSEAVAQQLRDAAAASYSAEQIQDNLVVLDGAEPFTLEANGSLSSAATLEGLGASLDGLGLSSGLSNNLGLSEGGSIVADLNELVSLDPILFETSSAVIVAESQITLDKAAEVLKKFPDTAIEIGGHTDSRGGADANKALSDARAQSVLAALIERGVQNELTAVGYGEEQLKEDPDDTVEQQQLNRRIEFRVL